VAETLIPISPVPLRGDLVVPPGATGVVILADGGGTAPRCAVTRGVAAQLREVGLATVLLRLTDEHEKDGRVGNDLPRMSERLRQATDWLAERPGTWHLRAGYFACSRAVGATVVAASHLGRRIGAIVLQDGRAELADAAIPRITAPTLLIVGEDDDEAVEPNREALESLRCDRRLHVVSGMGSVGEEPAAAVEVARVVTDWFRRYLC
jgi:pimeloyl-ACP methyl ester carboxylesterase